MSRQSAGLTVRIVASRSATAMPTADSITVERNLCSDADSAASATRRSVTSRHVTVRTSPAR